MHLDKSSFFMLHDQPKIRPVIGIKFGMKFMTQKNSIPFPNQFPYKFQRFFSQKVEGRPQKGIIQTNFFHSHYSPQKIRDCTHKFKSNNCPNEIKMSNHEYATHVICDLPILNTRYIFDFTQKEPRQANCSLGKKWVPIWAVPENGTHTLVADEGEGFNKRKETTDQGFLFALRNIIEILPANSNG